MKKPILALLTFVILFLCAGCIDNNSYEERYNVGLSDGYDEGYNDGYDDGYIWGEEDGFDDGYEEGYFWGSKDGYDEGFEEIAREIDNAIHYAREYSEWHPEEALMVIEEYHNDTGEYTEEEYLDAIESLSCFFEYFYYDMYG